MLTFYRSGRFETLGDVSPFVYKLETWMRFARVPYRTEIMPVAQLLQEGQWTGVLVQEQQLHIEGTGGGGVGEGQRVEGSVVDVGEAKKKGAGGQKFRPHQ